MRTIQKNGEVYLTEEQFNRLKEEGKLVAGTEYNTITDEEESGGGTTVTVNGEAVEEFDADTKLDKAKNPSFATNITGAVYGASNPDNPYPVTIDENGMIPVTYASVGNTIASRTKYGVIYGKSEKGEGILLTDTEFYNYARDPYWLPDGATSGTLHSSIITILLSGNNKILMLDGEMYRQVYRDNANINTTPTTIIYQHIDDNAIKTITIDITQNPRPWTLTVEENNKLDKENPTFPNDTTNALLYGVVNPTAGSHAPTLTDGMIPVSYTVQKRTIAMRDNQGALRSAAVYTTGKWASVTGYCATDADLANLIVESVPLTGASGTLTQAHFNTLRQSAVLTIILDNELYTKVINDTTSQVMTYQHISGSTIKTITVNSDRTWELTTQDILGDVNSVLDAILGV